MLALDRSGKTRMYINTGMGKNSVATSAKKWYEAKRFVATRHFVSVSTTSSFASDHFDLQGRGLDVYPAVIGATDWFALHSNQPLGPMLRTGQRQRYMAP